MAVDSRVLDQPDAPGLWWLKESDGGVSRLFLKEDESGMLFVAKTGEPAKRMTGVWSRKRFEFAPFQMLVSSAGDALEELRRRTKLPFDHAQRLEGEGTRIIPCNRNGLWAVRIAWTPNPASPGVRRLERLEGESLPEIVSAILRLRDACEG